MLDAGQIRDLAVCRWVANGDALLVLGPPGVGKTHLAVGLGREAIRLGYSVLFVQADFGEAAVVIGGVEQTTHFFAFDLPQSDAGFVRAYPAATAEAWVDGHVHAFAFLGGVPQSVLYDNDRCLVARILPDGTRKRARLFSGLLSHYLIHDRYGRPGKGNDKGAVEGLVGSARRNFMVPAPRFATWEDFNLWLEAQCRRRRKNQPRGGAIAYHWGSGNGFWVMARALARALPR